jgi:hypothetical protein
MTAVMPLRQSVTAMMLPIDDIPAAGSPAGRGRID